MSERRAELASDYQVQDFGTGEIRVTAFGDGTVDRACLTCMIAVELDHPTVAELPAFAGLLDMLPCFGWWQRRARAAARVRAAADRDGFELVEAWAWNRELVPAPDAAAIVACPAAGNPVWQSPPAGLPV